MSRKDYRNEIDQHRQSLSTETEEITSRPTRSQRVKKKRGNYLIRILFVIFILIPLCLLIYVWKFYEPGHKKVNVDKDVPTVTYEQNNKKDDENNASKDDESEKEESVEGEENDASALANDDEKESGNISSSKNSSSKGSTSTSGNSSSTSGSSSSSGGSSTSTNFQGSESSNQGSTDYTNTSGQKVHIVKEKENLYKIAAQYYSNPGNGVELIKKANGLKSDVVVVNQRLVIPQ